MSIQVWTRAGLEDGGYEGFLPLASLPNALVPKRPGIYVVLRDSVERPAFLESSVAGRFKGIDSMMELSALTAPWMDASPVLYIGKATWGRRQDGLRRRLSQYRRHGAGKAVGHRGGEYIWQLADSAEILVCWKVTSDDEVGALEGALVDDFEAHYGRWPFANRKHERRDRGSLC